MASKKKQQLLLSDKYKNKLFNFASDLDICRCLHCEHDKIV